MSTEPTLPERTKKVFKETVNIYRNDLNGLVSNPLPLILTIAGMVLFFLVIRWL